MSNYYLEHRVCGVCGFTIWVEDISHAKETLHCSNPDCEHSAGVLVMRKNPIYPRWILTKEQWDFLHRPFNPTIKEDGGKE